MICNLIKRLQGDELGKDYLFLNPVSAFGYLYNTVDYQRGLDMCLWLLDKCDSMWVFGDYLNSEGCKAEIQYCIEHKIPYHIIKDECNPFKNYPKCKCIQCSFDNCNDEYPVCDKNKIRKIYNDVKEKM